MMIKSVTSHSCGTFDLNSHVFFERLFVAFYQAYGGLEPSMTLTLVCSLLLGNCFVAFSQAYGLQPSLRLTLICTFLIGLGFVAFYQAYTLLFSSDLNRRSLLLFPLQFFVAF